MPGRSVKKMCRYTENIRNPGSSWIKSLRLTTQWQRGLCWVQLYETAILKQQHLKQEGCCFHGSEVWRKLSFLLWWPDTASFLYHLWNVLHPNAKRRQVNYQSFTCIIGKGKEGYVAIRIIPSPLHIAKTIAIVPSVDFLCPGYLARLSSKSMNPAT